MPVTTAASIWQKRSDPEEIRPRLTRKSDCNATTELLRPISAPHCANSEVMKIVEIWPRLASTERRLNVPVALLGRFRGSAFRLGAVHQRSSVQLEADLQAHSGL